MYPMPNIIMTIPQYDGNCIFFCEPIKNNIMQDGEFIRLIYSNKNISLNGVCLKMPFQIQSVSKYYNKCKYVIEMTSEIDKIKSIEMDILQKMNTLGKRPQYNIYEHLLCGYVKTMGDCNTDSSMLVLKISGIWETDMECGITYKFIAC